VDARACRQRAPAAPLPHARPPPPLPHVISLPPLPPCPHPVAPLLFFQRRCCRRCRQARPLVPKAPRCPRALMPDNARDHVHAQCAYTHTRTHAHTSVCNTQTTVYIHACSIDTHAAQAGKHTDTLTRSIIPQHSLNTSCINTSCINTSCINTSCINTASTHGRIDTQHHLTRSISSAVCARLSQDIAKTPRHQHFKTSPRDEAARAEPPRQATSFYKACGARADAALF